MWHFSRFLAAAAALLAAVGVCGAPLTPEQALARLQDDAKGRMRARNALTLQYTAVSDAGTPAAYIFGSGSGYEVVAADDRAPALLGYSDSGAFDAADIPPAMAFWLQTIAAEIEQGADRPHMRLMAQQGAPDERLPIAPLLTTKWDQGEPYNLLTPRVDGTPTYTGCVATAMAQLVYNRRYPEQGVGQYTSASDGQTFDYAATSFRYDDMLPNYATAQYTDEQANAVATLMLACGVAVDMQYGTGESGAIGATVGRALREQFGYSTAMRNYSRNYYNLDEWNDLAYAQLRDYGAFFLSGHNDQSGHAFVCDGYASDNFFHINWGWSGLSDGYFLLTALDPAQQGAGGSAAGYNQELLMLGNMRAPQEDDLPAVPQIGSNDAMQPSQQTVTKGDYVTIYYTPSNYGTMDLPAETIYGFAIAGDNIAELFIPSARFGFVLPIGNYFTQAINFSLQIPLGLPEGTYRIRPVFTLDEGATYHDIDMPASVPQALTMVVEGDTCTFVEQGSASVTVTGYELVTGLYYDMPEGYNVTLRNETDYEFNDKISLIGVDASNNLVLALESTLFSVMPHSEKTVYLQGYFYSISGYDYAEGAQYNMAFAIDATDTYYLISPFFTAIIGYAPGCSIGEVSDFAINGQTENAVVDPAGFEVSFNLPVAEGYFHYPIHILFWEADGNTYYNIGYSSFSTHFGHAPTTLQVKNTVACNNFKHEGQYLVSVRAGNINSADLAEMAVTARVPVNDPPQPTALDAVDVSGDLPVEWYTLQGVRIPYPTPGTVAIRRQGNTVRKILVR